MYLGDISLKVKRMSLRSTLLAAGFLLPLCGVPSTAQAADGWESTRWGMSPAEVSRLQPALRPVDPARRHDCVSSRVETLRREGVIELDGARWLARLCFGGKVDDRLRSVYLGPADGSDPDGAALRRTLTARYGTPLPQAADGTLPDLWEWVDGDTLVTLDAAPGSGWPLTYQLARLWPEGGLQPGTAAARAAQPEGNGAAVPARDATAGEWRFEDTSGSGGMRFQWVAPGAPNDYAALLLICGTEELRPGQVIVAASISGLERPRTIEARIGDGSRSVAVRGDADMNTDNLTLWATVPGSHPLFGLLAETRESRTLTLSAPQLRGTRRMPLRGALVGYRRFARSCGLQLPPG